MNQNPSYNFVPKAPVIPSGQNPRLLALRQSTTNKKKSILPILAGILILLSLLLSAGFWVIQNGYGSETITKLWNSKNNVTTANTSVTPIQIIPSQQIIQTPTRPLVGLIQTIQMR